MVSIVLTPPALLDLMEIDAYLAEVAGEEVAERVRLEIKAQLHRLASHPGLGHRRPDLTSKPYLFFRVYSYLVVYRRGSQPLQIARIVHAARDSRRLL